LKSQAFVNVYPAKLSAINGLVGIGRDEKAIDRVPILKLQLLVHIKRVANKRSLHVMKRGGLLRA